ncbi:RNA-directed DNA polymerase [Sphingobacterium psychroaquaticum]|nr:RNA-directed DNA polymerase [Sphingobacterium psychroaquaticum]
MNVLEPLFVAVFTRDTYSCIKGRGVHLASAVLRGYLKDVKHTSYCLKVDIKKFYPSVDNTILKSLLRKKIKDKEMLGLLDGIIDSAQGLPIGNYLSQYLSNFYLTYFDHWVKEVLGLRYYIRYADDILVLHSDKKYLRELHGTLTTYLKSQLRLDLKPNRGVFPVSLGIDFCGYVHYHTHTMLRKSIKQAFARAVKAKKSKASIASYMGWAKHCNSKNLIKKLTNEKF